MDLRSEDYAARGETPPPAPVAYRWLEVCGACGRTFLASLLEGECADCLERAEAAHRRARAGRFWRDAD